MSHLTPLNEEIQVLRKLGITETIYDNEVLNRNFYLTKTLIVSIDEPYSLNVSLVHRALAEWTRRHKLLRSKILRQNNTSLDKSPKLFVENRDISKNVQFIELNEAPNLVDIIEIEVKTPFYTETGQLWRVKILKLNNSNEYVFILTIHHGLADGKNANALLVEYLKILQEFLLGKSILEKGKEYEIKLSLEDLIRRQKDSFNYVPERNDLERSFFNEMLTPRHLKEDLNVPSETHGKFEFFKIDSSKLEKLISKMKNLVPQTKLTSVLVCIICLAIKYSFIKLYPLKKEDKTVSKMQFFIMIK
jgi:hypothetical protein